MKSEIFNWYTPMFVSIIVAASIVYPSFAQSNTQAASSATLSTNVLSLSSFGPLEPYRIDLSQPAHPISNGTLDGGLNAKPHRTLEFLPGFAPTKAYQREVRRLMIEEVNRVARDLKLSENLPITITNCSAYIGFPGHYINRWELGTIDSAYYAYYLVAGRTVSGIDMKHWEENIELARQKFWWPVSRLDTNAALKKGIFAVFNG